MQSFADTVRVAAVTPAVALNRAPPPNGDFVHADPVMVALLSRLRKVAASDASVLVCGESGTGKELIARYIHRHSTRANGPFIGINCAAIPEQLLESELFGHEKGSFSGALMQRIGKVEAAQKGTLLLDEISEMDRRLQAKLLRVIQEREVERVGGRSTIHLNVRFLATTNRDLAREVDRQTFREDLYFRLNVVSVQVPSLRDRRADIPVLADHFLRKYAGVSPKALSSRAHDLLLGYDWPGNVRELENTIHRAVVLTSERIIGPDTLEISLSPQPPVHHAAAQADGVTQPLHVIEQEAILSTLRVTGGNRTRTASILGLSIRTLRNRISLYARQGIDVPQYISDRAQ